MPESSVKFTYFKFRSLGELSRFIFAYAKAPYEDIRIDPLDPAGWQQWLDMQPSTPFRTLPILEIDGKVYGQSVAIARFLAKKYKLAGTTEEEQAHVDAVVDYQKGTAIKSLVLDLSRFVCSLFFI